MATLTQDPMLVDQPGPASSVHRPPAAHRTRPAHRARSFSPSKYSAGVLVTLALLAFWILVYALLITPVVQHGDQRRMYNQLREELSLGTAPLGGVILPGTPVAMLTIPTIGVSEVVVEGTTARELSKGPGISRDTALPGQQGLSVILGKSVSSGAPFARLGDLHAGDQINVVTGQGSYKFKITNVRHAGDPLPLPIAQPGSRLTLVSATGSGLLGGIAPSHSVYVDATLQGPSAPNPGGLRAITSGEAAWGTTTAGLTGLVFWLELLVLISLAFAWSAARWGLRPTWVVSVPLLLAALIGVSGAAFSLLPNLL